LRKSGLPDVACRAGGLAKFIKKRKLAFAQIRIPASASEVGMTMPSLKFRQASWINFVDPFGGLDPEVRPLQGYFIFL
jgi:hypothetical protein